MLTMQMDKFMVSHNTVICIIISNMNCARRIAGMKRWFILLTCITMLTGCGAQPAGVTSSAPPADVTKESTESAMMTSAPMLRPQRSRR